MARYSGPVIDLDVHHNPVSDSEILAYLPDRWKRYATAAPGSTISIKPPFSTQATMLPNGARMSTAFPEQGPPGSSYRMLKEQLLDPYNYHRALLSFDLGDYSGHLNPYFAIALCQAANDWNRDTWMSIGDDRLCTVVTVPIATPIEAAKEIRRSGRNLGIVGVSLTGTALGRPYGDPLYHPIYEAAAEMDLTISVHPAPGGDRPNSTVTIAGGVPGTETQLNVLFPQSGMHHISSLITHGVFEKYPDLRVNFREFGVAWLPYLLWRLDDNYNTLKRESAWVRDWPSEYFRKHVSLSTQPIEESPDPKDLIEVLSTVDGVEDLLAFSTDYPHITGDDPAYVTRLLPDAWVEKVMYENGRRIYRLPPVASAVGGVSA